MRSIALLAAIAALTGCMNVARPTVLPDGSKGYVVNRCRHLDKCMAKANEVCGGPYDLKTQSESFQNGYTIMVSCKAK